MSEIAGQGAGVAMQRQPLSARLRQRPLVLSVVSFVVLMAIWELAGRGGNPLLTSHPSAVYHAFLHQLATGQLQTAIMQSVQPLVLGFGLAVVVGIPVGLLLGRYWSMEASFGFYFIGLDAAPLVVFVPLFVLWFGLHLLVKVMLIFLFSLTPIVINTWMGVRGVPKSLVEVGQSFVASEPYIMRHIVLPHALPSILTGLRLGVGRAIIAMAVAELFTAISGLGGLLIKRSEDYDTAGIFVPGFVFVTIGILCNVLISQIERRAVPWHRALGANQE
jgi:NitT/TauT family transport system permease protein